MTEKFKSKNFSVRYKIGNNVFHYFSDTGKFKNGELFSEKELEIVRLYKKTKSTKEIAEQLSISHFTVDNHKKNVMSKLQTTSMDNVLEILSFIGIE